MRIQRISAARIGRIHSLDTGSDPLPGLVVFLGPNESGKSSLFHLLSSALYGFSPASRDRNPLSPWSGDPIEARLTIRLDDGETLEVHRRLLSSGWGRLTRGDRESELGNRPLDFVEHVPRGLYAQVYALALADLAGLRNESWDAVQDRLVESMGAGDLRPVRVVAEELEAEAEALWRPDRRGRPLVRRLQEEVRELRERRREAAERDAVARERARGLSALEGELEEVRRRRQEVREEEERLAGLVPLRRQLGRIEELVTAAGDRAELEGLPTDPVTRLADLQSEVEALRARSAALEAAAEGPRRRLEAFGELQGAVLEREEEVGEAVEAARRMRDDRERMRDLALVTRKLVKEVAPAAVALFAAPLTPEEAEEIRTFDVDDLRGRLAQAHRARSIRQAREEAARAAAGEEDEDGREEGGQGPQGRLLPIPWWSLLVAALALTALGLIGNRPLLFVGAAAALAGAAVLFWGERASRRSLSQGRTRILEEARRGISAARKAEEEAIHQARDPLRFLPVRPEILMDPEPEVADRLEVLQNVLGRYHERAREVLELRERVTTRAVRLRRLMEELGMDTRARGESWTRLQDALLKAREARDGSRGAREALEGVEAARTEVEGALSGAEARLSSLRSLLEDLGGGNVNQGVARAEERLRALRSATELREELERAHPDLEDRIEEIRRLEAEGARWIREGSPPEGPRLEGERLQARAEELSGQLAELREEIRQLERAETVERIDGAIHERMHRLEAALRDRDRKLLLARLVREAERRFREEHQPDLLRRASEHLEAITGGRYHRLLLGEDGPRTVFVRGGGSAYPLRVEHPLSTGTREQVYLSLRLAILDHLDEGHERLPVFLDETLVNWDRPRRERALDRLASLSSRRQFFIFTCHEEMARSLEGRGARVLGLEPGG